MFKQGLSVTFGLFYKIKLCLLFAQLINFLPQLYSKIFKSIPTKQAVYQTHSIFEPASPIVYWLHWVCDHSFCCSLAIEILIETGLYCLLSKIWLALVFGPPGFAANDHFSHLKNALVKIEFCFLLVYLWTHNFTAVDFSSLKYSLSLL